MININKHITRTAFISIGCVLAITLSIFENFIPQLPFMPPGAKIGLSNIVTMFTSYSIGLLPSLGITAAKSVFAGITRGFTAFLMSLSGGILSTISAYVLFLIKKHIILKNFTEDISFIFVGIISALFHNMAQLIVACIFVSEIMYYYIPFLIIFSILSGSLTGLILKIVLPVLFKFDGKINHIK